MEFLSFFRDEIVHRNFISEAFKAYLAADSEDQQNKFTFIFGDQRTVEFVGIFKVFSPLLNSILTDCPSSESKSIILPDFSLGSFQHLCHLLATGVTKVQDQADVEGVKSLAQCFNINMEKTYLMVTAMFQKFRMIVFWRKVLRKIHRNITKVSFKIMMFI